MTGKITVGTIQDTAGNTVASTYVTNGVVRAWVYFNTQDNPPNPDDSFGVSSLTDNNAEIEVNLTSTMANVYYCPVAGGGGSTNDPTTNPSNRSMAVIVMSTSKVDTEIYTTANNPDACQNHVAVIGDLA